MDIVRITMEGYGCEVHRGTVSKKEYEKIEKSINNIWNKNLFSKIEKNIGLKKETHDFGLIKGDIRIEVDGEIVYDTQINIFETFVDCRKEIVNYPKSEDIVITSVQHQEGVFSDNLFIVYEDFDINKLTLVKKDISNKIDNLLVSSLYCELYYDGELIPMTDNSTDLRMSRLYFENTSKDEKNKYR